MRRPSILKALQLMEIPIFVVSPLSVEFLWIFNEIFFNYSGYSAVAE